VTTYCSGAECQALDWPSHKVQCKELKSQRQEGLAKSRADGRPWENARLTQDWFAQTPGLFENAALLAWKHRNGENYVINVTTCKESSPDGRVTPQFTAVPRSQWRKPGLAASFFDRTDFNADDAYVVSIALEHAGTETWPAITSEVRYGRDAVLMDYLLFLKEAVEAKTFPGKVAGESTLQEHILAYPGLLAKLAADFEEPAETVTLPSDRRGCIRGLRGASHINDTLGLCVGADPNNPTGRLIVELADGGGFACHTSRPSLSLNYTCISIPGTRIIRGYNGCAIPS
jgi:hypothetical protein